MTTRINDCQEKGARAGCEGLLKAATELGALSLLRSCHEKLRQMPGTASSLLWGEQSRLWLRGGFAAWVLQARRAPQPGIVWKGTAPVLWPPPCGQHRLQHGCVSLKSSSRLAVLKQVLALQFGSEMAARDSSTLLSQGEAGSFLANVFQGTGTEGSWVSSSYSAVFQWKLWGYLCSV